MSDTSSKNWVLWPAHEEEVVITLAPVDTSPVDFIGTRHILLSEEKPSTQIGRTSKRETSLKASRHNTFFTSPIISRNHARISFNRLLQKVYIEDSGSMHGTRHNGAELEPHIKKSLHTGDLLKFGVGIERGQDCHAPYELKVAIRHGSGKKPNSHPVVYRVPDDTDVDSLASDESDSLASDFNSDNDQDTQVRHTSGILESHGLRAGSIIYFGEDESLPLGAHIGNNTSQAPTAPASDPRKGSKPLTVVDLTNTTDEPAYVHEPFHSYSRNAEASELVEEDSDSFDSNASEASDSPPSEVEIGRTWSERAPSVVSVNRPDEALFTHANDARDFGDILREQNEGELNSVLDALPGGQEPISHMVQSNYNCSATFSLPPVSAYTTWAGPIGVPTLPRLAELDTACVDATTAMHPIPSRYDGAPVRTPDYVAVPSLRQTFPNCQLSQEEYGVSEPLAGDQSSSGSFHGEFERQESPCTSLLEIDAPAETEALMSGAIPSLESTSMLPHSADEKESSAENIADVTKKIEPVSESRKRPIDMISQGETVQPSSHVDKAGPSELPAPVEKRLQLVPRGLASRQNKRLRKAAEAIGFVAIGGVAVLSTLIATAPTF